MDEKNKSLGDLSTNFWSKEFRCPCQKCKKKKGPGKQPIAIQIRNDKDGL